MIRLWLAAILLAAPGAAQAACTLSASGVSFGVYDPFSATAADIAGTVTLDCTANSGVDSFTIALSIGGGTGYTSRRLASGADVMPYQLFIDPARSQIWGDGTGSTSVNGGDNTIPSAGGSQVFQVYGRIPALLIVNPGSYSDLIIATLTY